VYDSLTKRYTFACPSRGETRVALSAFRRLERLPGASHPAVFRVSFACACGEEHLGLVSHDELDYAPLGLDDGVYLNLMTSRVEPVARELGDLRELGVGVALDDFGAGEASLASLTRLPIDILKLDRSFVARVDRDPQSRALCESVVGIGRALGLDVVAEGVETPDQLAAVRAFGVGFAQGFLLARPMAAADLARAPEERDGVLWPGLIGSK
jgi:predicted signal transduction protein with EAL and GGDEF domain